MSKVVIKCREQERLHAFISGVFFHPTANIYEVERGIWKPDNTHYVIFDDADDVFESGVYFLHPAGTERVYDSLEEYLEGVDEV